MASLPSVVLGFIGVLIVVQPGGSTFQAASLLPVVSAFLYSIFMISARWIHASESMWTMMLYVVLFPLIYTAPFALLVWVPVGLEDVPFFVAIAICGSLGITFIGQAFRMAPAAVVAPFDYTALLWATLLGWLIWGEAPGLHIWLGWPLVVVSGLALGVDRSAHVGALAYPEGTTLAVLGSGVLQVYPYANIPLAKAIAARGALVSEVAPDARPNPASLVARNRLISGLSEGLIVVESSIDGGAMHAARRALEQGRTVYAVDNAASGNRALLDAGATPITPDGRDWPF